MISSDKNTIFSSGGDSAKLLYVVAFLMSFGNGVLWVSWPFVIKGLNGTAADVGNCFALHMGIYMCTCLAIGFRLGHLNARRVIQNGVVVVILAVGGMCGVVMPASQRCCQFDPVWLMIGLALLIGMSMGFFWPYLMGWLSGGYEGRDLNRRLGMFNVAWVSGGIISPWIGGILVERSSLLVLAAAEVGIVLCFVAVSFTRGEVRESAGQNNNSPVPNDFNEALLLKFRWIARISLLCVMVCIGLVRTQLGLLLVEPVLGYSESDFGKVITVVSLAYFAVFAATGKWHFWHFRIAALIGAQILVVLSMVIILHSSRLWEFFVAAAVLGTSASFIYASHLYYGVSGSKRRSRRMAIHETTQSLGMVVGSLAGGYLYVHISGYAPYWFGIVFFGVGFLAQIIVWFALKPTDQTDKQSV